MIKKLLTKIVLVLGLALMALLTIRLLHQIALRPTVYNTALITLTLITTLAIIYEIYDRRKSQKQNEKISTEIIEKLDELTLPLKIKPNLKLGFLQENKSLSKITVEPKQVNSSAFYSVSFILENTGDASAFDISIFIEAPEDIKFLEDIPKEPQISNRFNLIFSAPALLNLPRITHFDAPVKGPWVNDNKPNKVRYEVKKLKSNFVVKLPEVIIAASNKTEKYKLKYTIIPENSESFEGEIILETKPI
jgi:hypothetical protein